MQTRISAKGQCHINLPLLVFCSYKDWDLQRKPNTNADPGTVVPFRQLTQLCNGVTHLPSRTPGTFRTSLCACDSCDPVWPQGTHWLSCVHPEFTPALVPWLLSSFISYNTFLWVHWALDIDCPPTSQALSCLLSSHRLFPLSGML